MRYSGPFTLLANSEAAISPDAYFREDSPMINHLYLRSMLVLPVLGLAGSVAHAQATTATQTDPKKTPAATTTKPGAPAAAPVVPVAPKASGRSALPASDKIPPTPPTGSAPASDAAQKKHIAGVKYEDRTASNPDAGSKEAVKAPPLDTGSKDAVK
jgi:hypothetical protein